MITYKDVGKLTHHATEFASMMEDDEIEQVIAELIEVKNLRRRDRCKTKW